MLNWRRLSYRFAEPGPTMVIDFSIKINETSLFSSHKPFFGFVFFFGRKGGKHSVNCSFQLIVSLIWGHLWIPCKGFLLLEVSKVFNKFFDPDVMYNLDLQSIIIRKPPHCMFWDEATTQSFRYFMKLVLL